MKHTSFWVLAIRQSQSAKLLSQVKHVVTGDHMKNLWRKLRSYHLPCNNLNEEIIACIQLSVKHNRINYRIIDVRLRGYKSFSGRSCKTLRVPDSWLSCMCLSQIRWSRKKISLENRSRKITYQTQHKTETYNVVTDAKLFIEEGNTPVKLLEEISLQSRCKCYNQYKHTYVKYKFTCLKAECRKLGHILQIYKSIEWIKSVWQVPV